MRSNPTWKCRLLLAPLLVVAISVAAAPPNVPGGNPGGGPAAKTCANGTTTTSADCGNDLTVSLNGSQAPNSMNASLSWSVNSTGCSYELSRAGFKAAPTGSSYLDMNLAEGTYSYNLTAHCKTGTGQTTLNHHGAASAEVKIVACSKPPVVTPTALPGTMMKNPKKLATVTLTGRVVQDARCKVASANYQVADEFMTFAPPPGPVTVANGLLTGSIPGVPLDLKHHQKDMDGRTYTITVSVTNQAGTGSGEAVFRVMHDKRDGQGKTPKP